MSDQPISSPPNDEDERLHFSVEALSCVHARVLSVWAPIPSGRVRILVADISFPGVTTHERVRVPLQHIPPLLLCLKSVLEIAGLKVTAAQTLGEG